jgi:AcrR family transcriptional regulator
VPARAYHAPNRLAAAERTRKTILASAKVNFEDLGWARTTIPAIAGAAGVSPKTVEAHFATKANLLAEVVAEVARAQRDIASLEINGEARNETLRHFQQATSAITALPYHAAYATPLLARSAKIARAVDEAAPTDPAVADIAARMRRNHDYGADWAARAIIGKRGLATGMTLAEATRVFRFAIDPATYRTLTGELGLDDDGVREWMLRYERGMLLLRT